MEVPPEAGYEEVIAKRIRIGRVFPNGGHFREKDGTGVSLRPIPGGLMGIAVSSAPDSGLGTSREISDTDLSKVVEAVRVLRADFFDLRFAASYHSAGVYMVQLYKDHPDL